MRKIQYTGRWLGRKQHPWCQWLTMVGGGNEYVMVLPSALIANMMQATHQEADSKQGRIV